MATVFDETPLPTRFSVVGEGAGDRTLQTPLRVLLVTEGTYPYAWGGVSTWADSLLTVLDDVRFHLVSIIAAPDLPLRFDVPPNVESVCTVPLWGVHDVKETWPRLGAGVLHRSRAATTSTAVATEFVPAFEGFLREILAVHCDARALAGHIHALYRYLRDHDLRTSLRAPETWAAYTSVVQQEYGWTARDLHLPELELWELTTGMQWVSRWLFPLAGEIPEVDVVHAAMAGICSIVSAAAVMEHGAGFLLTEHGVYLRERYIAEASRRDSYFLKLLGLRFARRMTELAYTLADQISPCCDYNSRWEREVGADSHQLETIYYGVDSDAFSADRPVSEHPHRVVWVGRINPLKDLETLLRAAALVAEQRPDVEFSLYGEADPEDDGYYQQCLALHDQLGLGESVRFRGYTDNPAEAFLSGDLVVLSSISEGFPYSTLEAMLCGRPVVATSVGGLPEQVSGAGTVVDPRRPDAMAQAILDILGDPERCAALGRAAREKAMGEFGQTRFRGRHHSSYLSLSPRHSGWQVTVAAAWTPEQAPTPRQLLPAVLPEQPAVTSVLNELAQVDLALDVEGRDPVPLDVLEVAAVIESIGVTDGLARKRYGERDVFALAGTLFDALVANRRAGVAPALVRSARVRHRRGGGVFDAARYPSWALLPSLALLATAWAMTTMGHFDRDRVSALTVGMTCGMLATNGLTLAMGRRASVSLSLGKLAAARRFFLGCVAVGVGWTAALTAVMSVLPFTAVGFLRADRSEFVVTSVVVAMLWITASALSLVTAAGWAGVGLTLGLAVVTVVNRVLTPDTRHHLLLGSVAGVVVALVVMLTALEHNAALIPRGRVTGRQRLPSIGYMVQEGLPYFVYGTLGVAMLVAVHAIGWIALHGDRSRIATLEVGLFLPLLPAVLGAGRAERSLRDFWEHAADLQQSTTARERASFGSALHQRYLRELAAYVAGIVANSLLTAGVIELLLRAHWLDHLVTYGDPHAVRVLYVTGLLAYGLIGIGQFNAMFSLSFLRHRRPLRSLFAGLVLTVLAGAWLVGHYGYQAAALGLAAGAFVYALDAYLSVRPLLLAADHHYVAAV